MQSYTGDTDRLTREGETRGVHVHWHTPHHSLHIEYRPGGRTPKAPRPKTPRQVQGFAYALFFLLGAILATLSLTELRSGLGFAVFLSIIALAIAFSRAGEGQP